MSKKLWSGLITVFIIFIITQIIFNIRKQGLEKAPSDAPEIIVDMSTLDSSILAQELQEKEQDSSPRGQEPDSLLPKNVAQIQKALKAADFNPGPIDGKLGSKTKAAIRRFQKTHDLKVDAKVGRNTWRLLKKYLPR